MSICRQTTGGFTAQAPTEEFYNSVAAQRGLYRSRRTGTTFGSSGSKLGRTGTFAVTAAVT